MQRFKKLFISLLLLHTLYITAQPSQNKAWLFLTHTQKFTEKWSLLADLQVRSADDYEYTEAYLLRSQLSYTFNNNHSAGLGYVFFLSKEIDDNITDHEYDNRIFEQYTFTSPLQLISGNSGFAVRLRFEQRFMRPQEATLFSQRFRIAPSLQIPVYTQNNFASGVYLSLQNELFLNVHNKQNSNGYFFDQNRTQVAIGYKWNDSLETELVYMRWHENNADSYVKSNVIQLMVTTTL